MESIFTRLSSYRPREKKHSEEDFFTEAFVGVMERHCALLTHLLSSLIQSNLSQTISFSEDKLSIRSQCSFASSDGSDRPDIVIEGCDSNGNKFVFFIENKIGSTEGKDQLSRYAKQLENKYPAHDYNQYLLYITKYSEQKNEVEIMQNIKPVKPSFIQLTWHEIYCILFKYTEKLDKPLIMQLLQFMEDMKMTLKLSLGDISNTMIAKKTENIYSEIITRAWEDSTLSTKITKHNNKGGNSYTDSKKDQSSQYSKHITDDKIRFFYGFWFNHDNLYYTAISNANANTSTEFPILFISIVTDKKEKNKVIKKLKNIDGIKTLEKEGWEWKDDNDTEWVLFAKSIKLEGLYKQDNFAEYFESIFKDEFNSLTSTLKDLF